MSRLQDFIAKNGGYYLSQLVNWKGDTNQLFKYYKQYSNLLKLTQEQHIDNQLNSLKQLLIHTEKNVPYYSNLFQKYNFTPSSISSIDDISVLPPLKRSHLQNQLKELTSKNISSKKMILNQTGGSTGNPVKLYQDLNYRLRGKAAEMVFNSIAGWFIGAKTAILWGSETDLKRTKTIKGKIHEYFTNYQHYNAYYMSDKDMHAYYNDMQKSKPDVLIGYAESLNLFASFLLNNNLSPIFPNTSIISSAGTLFPDMRENIQAAFNVPVFNRYGSREVGIIASECTEHNGLHINPFDQIVQLEPSNTDSRILRILVTNLRNYATPLIRYEIGDTSTGLLKTSSCSLNTPRLRDISGRITSIITTSNGKIIYGGFRQIVSPFTGIAKYQFVQEEISKYIFRIVPNSEFKMEDVPAIRKVILNEVGIDSIVEVKIVDTIPLTSSGKHLYTISKVQSNEHV